MHVFNMFGHVTFKIKTLAANMAGKCRWGVSVDSMDVFGQDMFMFINIAAALVWAREGGRRNSRMDGFDVDVQVRFPWIAFAAACMWTGDGGIVCVFDEQMSFHDLLGCHGYLTQAAQEGGRIVCVFVEQVICHAMLGFSGLLTQAAKEGGRADRTLVFVARCGRVNCHDVFF